MDGTKFADSVHSLQNANRRGDGCRAKFRACHSRSGSLVSPPMSDKDNEAIDDAEIDRQAEVWEKIIHRPEFEALLAAKKRFIVPACLFFLVYYFALIVIVGWFPDLAKKQIGPANIAYWFALSQFFMAWIVAWVYTRAAARFDRLADDLLGEHANPDTDKK